MIDTQANPKSNIRLMVLVTFLGIVSAIGTFVFITLVHHGTHLVWVQTAQVVGIDMRLFTLLVAFITNPFSGALLGLESVQGGVTGVTLYFWALFPSLLASAVAPSAGSDPERYSVHFE